MNKQLKFADGKFTIMSLGDLHEKLHIDTDEKRKKRQDMHNLVKTGIDRFHPDLVILLGDTLTKRDETEDFSQYKAALRDILKPVIEADIPFCFVLGNHEHDQGQEEQTVQAYTEIPNCVGINDETAPRGNFNCNILVKNTEGTKNILNLWFIDSNNKYHDRAFSKYDWVNDEQIEWYENKAHKIAEENGGIIPAILFQHIPVCEEYELLREAKPYEYFVSVKGHQKRKNKRYVLKDGVEGYLGEGPCTPCYNGGQFRSWKKTGDVVAAFFGHDHTNDFTGIVDGIMLGQNKTSGFCCYTDGCRSCIRITTVTEENPRDVKSKVYHFKELGLKSVSLGPIEKRITDRQSINLYFAAKVGAVALAVSGVAAILINLIK